MVCGMALCENSVFLDSNDCAIDFHMEKGAGKQILRVHLAHRREKLEDNPSVPELTHRAPTPGLRHFAKCDD
jgi:hypothetical protein